jgi:glucosamine-6-phosphate deaminase
VQWIIANDYEELCSRAAAIFAAQLAAKPDSVLGLATGATPVGIYRLLRAGCTAGELDFSAVRTVNLDEYYPMPANDSHSYRHFMEEQLFGSINILPENTHLPDGTSPDPEAECSRYDALIRSLGEIDLQILGIGGNGHIGFNEPSDHFAAGTHLVSLAENTRCANARFFPSPDAVPRQAITMGIGAIMSARHVLLLASGAEKAQIVGQALFGPVTPAVPASILQFHPNCTVLLDRSAAAFVPMPIASQTEKIG